MPVPSLLATLTSLRQCAVRSYAPIGPQRWWVIAAIFCSALPVSGQWRLEAIGGFRHGETWDAGAAEIVKYDPATRRLFVVNGEKRAIDILSITNPTQPALVRRVPLADWGDAATHVAVKDGVVAVAVAARPRYEAGHVVFLDTEGTYLGRVQVGALPDMLEFTPAGDKVLVANEGEPSDDYLVDPEGSLSIISLAVPREDIQRVEVATVSLSCKLADAKSRGIRVFGPGATVAMDVEPEYLAISPDGKRAWVVLQENNALAIVDVERASLETIVSLGEKPFDTSQSGLDASDVDRGIHIAQYPVRGLYQPDGIATFSIDGETFLITANEGDHRKYAGFREDSRVADLLLDPTAFPQAAELQRPDRLGRLWVSTVDADPDGDGDIDSLCVFGARSFSIRDAQGGLLFDSGDALERWTAEEFPEEFNSDHDTMTFDSRSDDKGPEPEGVAVGRIGNTQLAFVGLERFSGVAVVDISQPRQPRMVHLQKGSSAPPSGEVADQGPEGLTFISAEESPTGEPLLAVAYEVSGTLRIFAVRPEK